MTVPYGTPHIQPDAPWRLLLKGMGGGAGEPEEPGGGTSGNAGPHMLTFNAPTKLWSRTNTGIISYPSGYTHAAGGPFRVNPVAVKYDPIHMTGTMFWELKEGDHAGWLVSMWTNTLGYGNITVTQDGGTGSFNRGPGKVLATIASDGSGDQTAHSVGASLNYNAAGEMHFTVLVDSPLVNIVAPKETHYAIEFKDLDSGQWNEVFAGLVWDLDATDTEVVYTGVDYLGLFRYAIDERFNPKAPSKPAPTGSYYVGKKISEIIDAHLDYCIAQPDAPVNFLKVDTIPVSLSEKISGVYSTMMDGLGFIVGLLNSHRAGTGKNSQIKVVRVGTEYHVQVLENPGVNRDSLLIRYGSLAHGYRSIKFGADWASRVNLIGQSREGSKVFYASDSSGIDQSVFGRIGLGGQFVVTEDENDLKRRARQVAVDASRLGKALGVGLKLGSFRPGEGYDLLDHIPVYLKHGGVDTGEWTNEVAGSSASTDPRTGGYYTVFGIKWETYDDGHWMPNLNLWPQGGGMALGNSDPMSSPGGNTVEDGGGGAKTLTISGFTAKSTDILVALLNTKGSVQPTVTSSGWEKIAEDVTAGATPTAMAAYWKPVNADIVDPSISFTAPDGGVWNLFAIRNAAHMKPAVVTAGGSVATWGNMPITMPAPQGSDCYDIAAYAFDEVDLGGGFTDTIMPGALPLFSPAASMWWVYRKTASWAHSPYFSGGRGSWNWKAFGITIERIGYDLLQASPVTPRTSTVIGSGAPDPTNPANAQTYIDQTTGQQYTRNDDTESWDEVSGSAVQRDFDFTASTTWTINHALNGYPQVILTDGTGAEIWAAVVYTSTSQITVTFSEAVAGTAHLR